MIIVNIYAINNYDYNKNSNDPSHGVLFGS